MAARLPLFYYGGLVQRYQLTAALIVLYIKSSQHMITSIDIDFRALDFLIQCARDEEEKEPA